MISCMYYNMYTLSSPTSLVWSWYWYTSTCTYTCMITVIIVVIAHTIICDLFGKVSEMPKLIISSIKRKKMKIFIKLLAQPKVIIIDFLHV